MGGNAACRAGDVFIRLARQLAAELRGSPLEDMAWKGGVLIDRNCPEQPVSLAGLLKLAAASGELSSQQYRPRTRLRVYPGGRLLSRECSFRLAQQWRPSGTVIVPVQHCWWVRG